MPVVEFVAIEVKLVHMMANCETLTLKQQYTGKITKEN